MDSQKEESAKLYAFDWSVAVWLKKNSPDLIHLFVKDLADTYRHIGVNLDQARLLDELEKLATDK